MPCLWKITLRHAFGSYPSDRIKRLYDINVHGAFFTAREAAKHMIPQGGGSIILVASMSANVCLILVVCSCRSELVPLRLSTYLR
jgi:NAD(P)-dependent dehydrogenase (short-subunit alcohol dehydrogenase family)